MSCLNIRFLVPTILLVGVNVAGASTILTANLTNSQENPAAVPTTSTGSARPASFGTAQFLLNDAMTALSFTATIFNLDFTGAQTADVNDNVVAAHIHASATVTPTTNAGVVWGFIGTPFSDTNPTNTTVTPFATGVGATISGQWDLSEGNNTTLSAQLQNILSGHSYLNFHTTQFTGGEIRGTLEVVPEPGTVLLLLTGVAALALSGRRRKGA